MGLFDYLFGSPGVNTLRTNDNDNDNDNDNQTNQPEPLDLRDGSYESPDRFNSNFKYKVEQDLVGTLKDPLHRRAVAELFYESRGGNGVTKQEIKDGLYRLQKEKVLNEDQVWAVRNKYGIF